MRGRATCSPPQSTGHEQCGFPTFSDGQRRQHAFRSRAHVAMSGHVFGCHSCPGGPTGIWGVQAKVVAEHLQCTGQPRHQELFDPNVHHAENEKPAQDQLLCLLIFCRWGN